MMERSRWSAISGDPEVWKKIAVGGGSLMLLLPTPIALGVVNTDLEAQVQQLKTKEKPKTAYLPEIGDFGKLLGSGFGPSLVYLGALLMYAIATIPLGLSYFQLHAIFGRGSQLAEELGTKMEISTPVTQVVLFVAIALLGLGLQAMVAASLPVALAQYARGDDPLPALSVTTNAMTVVEMGSSYWLKASGIVVSMLFMTALFITGGFDLHWLLSTALSFLVCSLGFVSLVLSCRHALEHVAAELPVSHSDFSENH